MMDRSIKSGSGIAEQAASDPQLCGLSSANGSCPSSAPRPLRPFLLERFFARHEFVSPHLLAASDCEPLSLAAVTAAMTPDVRAMWDGLVLGYSQTQGLPELRTAIAEEVYSSSSSKGGGASSDERGGGGGGGGGRPSGGLRHQQPASSPPPPPSLLPVSADHLLVSCPQEAIFLAMTCCVARGDNVVAQAPAYQSLYEVAASRGAHVSLWHPVLGRSGPASVEYDTADLAAIVQSCSPKPPTLIVVNFPHNPTGASLGPDGWRHLLDIAHSCGARLFSDEMYRGLELDGPTPPAAVQLSPHAISLGGMSKAYSMRGTRIGWLACHDVSLLSAMSQLKDYTTICSPPTSELLALAGLRGGRPILTANVARIKDNIALVDELIKRWDHVLAWTPPHAGSVAFPRLLTGELIDTWCDRLVSEAGVLLLPATVYEHPASAERGHFRLGLGRANTPEALHHLEQWLLRTYGAPPTANCQPGLIPPSVQGGESPP